MNPGEVSSTPAAQWRSAGEKDPHGTQYDCERAALTLGKLTDDELANGVFMNADQPMSIERVLARDPDYHPPIVWLTAAKERIRWLSRALERALADTASQADAAIASGGAQEPESPEAFALRMLVAGGLVSQEKVDSALKIAAKFRAHAGRAGGNRR